MSYILARRGGAPLLDPHLTQPKRLSELHWKHDIHQ
jgi:hypothetical protein